MEAADAKVAACTLEQRAAQAGHEKAKAALEEAQGGSTGSGGGGGARPSVEQKPQPKTPLARPNAVQLAGFPVQLGCGPGRNFLEMRSP